MRSKLFNDYLKEFPKGFFRDQAFFYRGESYFRQEQYASAPADYGRIIDENRLQFLESALVRASWIMFYQNKDYSKANDYYTQLYNVASYKENTYVAMKGLLRTSYLLNDYDEVILNAGRILASDMVTTDEQIEAHFTVVRPTWQKARSIRHTIRSGPQPTSLPMRPEWNPGSSWPTSYSRRTNWKTPRSNVWRSSMTCLLMKNG